MGDTDSNLAGSFVSDKIFFFAYLFLYFLRAVACDVVCEEFFVRFRAEYLQFSGIKTIPRPSQDLKLSTYLISSKSLERKHIEVTDRKSYFRIYNGRNITVYLTHIYLLPMQTKAYD